MFKRFFQECCPLFTHLVGGHNAKPGLLPCGCFLNNPILYWTVSVSESSAVSGQWQAFTWCVGSTAETHSSRGWHFSSGRKDQGSARSCTALHFLWTGWAFKHAFTLSLYRLCSSSLTYFAWYLSAIYSCSFLIASLQTVWARTS